MEKQFKQQQQQQQSSHLMWQNQGSQMIEENSVLREKQKQYSKLILMLVGALSLIAVFGDLRGFFGFKFVIFSIILCLAALITLWKDELFRIQQSLIKFLKNPFNSATGTSKSTNSNQFNNATSPQRTSIWSQQSSSKIKKPTNSIENNLNNNLANNTSMKQSPIIVNNIYDIKMTESLGQSASSYQNSSQNIRNSLNNNNNTSNNIQHRNSYQSHYSTNNNDGVITNRLSSSSAASAFGGKKEIERKDINKARKWGANQRDSQGLLAGVSSSSTSQEQPKQQVSQPTFERRSQGFSLNSGQRFSQSQPNNLDKIKNDRDMLFGESIKKQSEFQSVDQMQNAIQKAKIYAFHVIKERASEQLTNILEINKLLFEQFNLILAEAEIAQSMIQELENAFDAQNTDKKRVTIDDVYHFKSTFEKSKHSIWALPYDYQINNDLIRQLLELAQKREELDGELQVPGYNLVETRRYILTRLFYMYNAQDCEVDQKKAVHNKQPTDIEIAAHTLFVNINQICQQQKDLIVCKVEQFDVQCETQTIPVLENQKDKFFVLLCNRINFEPYFMLQIGSDILHTIQGPQSFFNVVVYYFMNLKNSLFPQLSASECKDALESPAKYILNYENESYRKGYDRYNYF